LVADGDGDAYSGDETVGGSGEHIEVSAFEGELSADLKEADFVEGSVDAFEFVVESNAVGYGRNRQSHRINRAYHGKSSCSYSRSG